MSKAQLPQYKCHKVVRAAKILGVDDDHEPPALLLEVDGTTVRHDVTDAFLDRHKPKGGAYLVQYEPDGYESVSPGPQFEDGCRAGETPALEGNWNDAFVREWLALPPALAELDLRGALYVGREHAPLITPEDRLSSDGAELLAALLSHPDMAASLKPRLATLSRSETTILMDRLLDRAHQEQEWGVPPILDACLTLGEIDPAQGGRLSSFLIARPASQIRPGIVPKISDQPWAVTVFDAWTQANVAAPVKAAITRRRVN
jgi:hypothetical protein